MAPRGLFMLCAMDAAREPTTDILAKARVRFCSSSSPVMSH
jgi:hypothetical protein